MDMAAYKDEIKVKLGGSVLNLELDDTNLEKVINAAFREIQRYIDTTRLATVSYSPCIDLSEMGVSSVSRVFRAQGYLGNTSEHRSSSMADPVYAAQWQLLSGSGSMYNVQDWTYRYGAWNTMMQIRNTMSTDLIFRFDKHTNQLYINCAFDKPRLITIEYIPRYDSVEEIVSDFWIDKLVNLSVALTKVTIGRIRSRYTQSNALWSQDGETLLNEGNAELETLREQMRASSQLVYPID